MTTRPALAIAIGIVAMAIATSVALHAHAQQIPPKPVRTMRLHVGEVMRLDSRDVRSYSISTRGVLDVRVASDGLLFVATRPGIARVLIVTGAAGPRRYDFVVVARQRSY